MALQDELGIEALLTQLAELAGGEGQERVAALRGRLTGSSQSTTGWPRLWIASWRRSGSTHTTYSAST